MKFSMHFSIFWINKIFKTQRLFKKIEAFLNAFINVLV
ncbi:hypothetical protein SAMN06265346_103281 [Flavobacterium hercynium]|nr:hypothetical protein SAMN06265346_103281 [Flavobacterium hercynium]